MFHPLIIKQFTAAFNTDRNGSLSMMSMFPRLQGNQKKSTAHRQLPKNGMRIPRIPRFQPV